MNASRKTIIAGNWKMNKSPQEADALIQELVPLVANAPCEVVICPPFTDLPLVCQRTAHSRVKVGAQNVHYEQSGAFTGEISPTMLLELGVEYVIIGHSERRQYFGETDEMVQRRIQAAIKAGLTAILCVGETWEQRERQISDEIICAQVKTALFGISAQEMGHIVIAYEPIWAVGTGHAASAAQAEAICAMIRSAIQAVFGAKTAQQLPLLYGGSMTASNAPELLHQPNIDGGLIGGASLRPREFAAIVEAAV